MKIGAAYHILYLDHLLLKNTNLNRVETVRLPLREVIGWLVAENSDYILLSFERPVNENLRAKESIERVKETSMLIFKPSIILWTELSEVRIEGTAQSFNLKPTTLFCTKEVRK